MKVMSELHEGEMVVMNPRKHLDLFDESRFPQAEGRQEENAKSLLDAPARVRAGG